MATNPWDDPFERVRLNRAAAGLRPEPNLRPLQFGGTGIDVRTGMPVSGPTPPLRGVPEMSTPTGPSDNLKARILEGTGQGGARPAATPRTSMLRTAGRLGGAALAGEALLSDDLYGDTPQRIARREVAPQSVLGGMGLALGRGAGYVSEAASAASERTPDYLAAVRNEANPFTIGGAALRQLGSYGRNFASELFNPAVQPSMRTAAPAAAAAAATGEMGPQAPTDAQLWDRDMKERQASLAAIRARSQVRPEFSALGLDEADTARNVRQLDQMRANIANFPEQYTNAQGEVIRPRENAMRSMQEGAYNAGPAITEAQAKQTLAERLAGYENAMRSMRESRAIQAGVPVEAMEATGGNLRQAIAMSRAAAASNLARNARPVPGYGGRGGYGPQVAAPAQPASPYTPEGAEFAKAMAGGDPVLAAEMLGAAGRLPKEAQPRNAQELTALMSLYRQFGGMRPNLPGPAAQVPLADFAGVRKEPVKGVWPTVKSWTPWGHNKRYVAYNRAGQPFDTGVTARDDGFFMDPVVNAPLESLLDPQLRGR